MKKLNFVVCILLLLPGCSGRYSKNGEGLYLRSYNGVKLEVPSPLTRENISDFYNLPPQNQDARVSIVPPT